MCLGNLAASLGDLGQNARAIEYLEQALAISCEVRDRSNESVSLGNLGNRYAEIGQSARAIEYCERALLIDREIENLEYEAGDLVNLGEFYKRLGRPDEARRYCTEGLSIARRIGYRLFEALAHENMGELHLSQENWSDAAREFEQAIEIADDIGDYQSSRDAREHLALVNVYRKNLVAAREIVEAARKYDVLLDNHRTSVMLGVVALLQGDRNAAERPSPPLPTKPGQLIALTPDRYEALDVHGTLPLRPSLMRRTGTDSCCEGRLPGRA